MRPPEKALKARLARGEQLIGAILRMPNEGLVELAGLVGLDFVILDTEHGPGDQVELLHHVSAAAANGIPVLVRVGAPGEVLRALDLGAEGIIAPHVSSVAEAETVVRAAHYPPAGDRGLATYTRAGHYGLADPVEHVRRARSETLVVVMIEDARGVADAAGIAAVPGVDALFVGPADLAHDLGRTGDTTAPEVLAALEVVTHAARATGCNVLTIAGTLDAARRQLGAGSNLVVYNVQSLLAALFCDLAGARPTLAPPVNEPLVLLPGMLGDDRLFDDVLAALGPSRPFHLARIDLDASVTDAAESVLAAAPPRFALLGHSLGGIVALEIVRRAPSRVTRLVLVNSSARPPRAEQLETWANQLAALDDGRFAEVADELTATYLLDDAPAEQRGLASAMAQRVGAGGLARQLAAQQGRVDLRPLLGSIAVPTLVVSGARDTVCPPELQGEIAAAVPGARHVTIAGAGHLTPIEAPGALADALMGFFAV